MSVNFCRNIPYKYVPDNDCPIQKKPFLVLASLHDKKVSHPYAVAIEEDNKSCVQFCDANAVLAEKRVTKNPNLTFHFYITDKAQKVLSYLGSAKETVPKRLEDYVISCSSNHTSKVRLRRSSLFEGLIEEADQAKLQKQHKLAQEKYTEAIRWINYTRQDFPLYSNSYTSLGELYMYGKGVSIDKQKAMQLTMRAAYCLGRSAVATISQVIIPPVLTYVLPDVVVFPALLGVCGIEWLRRRKICQVREDFSFTLFGIAFSLCWKGADSVAGLSFSSQVSLAKKVATLFKETNALAYATGVALFSYLSYKAPSGS